MHVWAGGGCGREGCCFRTLERRPYIQKYFSCFYKGQAKGKLLTGLMENKAKNRFCHNSSCVVVCLVVFCWRLTTKRCRSQIIARFLQRERASENPLQCRNISFPACASAAADIRSPRYGWYVLKSAKWSRLFRWNGLISVRGRHAFVMALTHQTMSKESAGHIKWFAPSYVFCLRLNRIQRRKWTAGNVTFSGKAMIRQKHSAFV